MIALSPCYLPHIACELQDTIVVLFAFLQKTLFCLFVSGEKPFECNECGRRFARSTDLKVHLPVHSEDKPYKCGECEKMFTRFSTLKEHIRTHTGM